MRNKILAASTLGLMGCLAGSVGAVTLWSSSSYSRLEYGALPAGVTQILSQNGGPADAAAKGLGISSTTNNGGTAPIHAEIDALTSGAVDIINAHSDATAVAGSWNILLKNNTNSVQSMSVMWHWSIAAMAAADPTDTSFSYATASIGGNVISDTKQAYVVNPDNQFLSGDYVYRINIAPGSLAFLTVSATAGGSADVANLPEPGSVAMMLGGCLVGAGMLRKRRKLA